MLNPEVSVREKGSVEKCSFCIQRIQQQKTKAKQENISLADGAIKTACQQSCPAQAIVFGDMNDKNSRMHATLENPRRYGLLEEFNFRPSVSYLRAVRNREDESVEHESAEDSHHA